MKKIILIILGFSLIFLAGCPIFTKGDAEKVIKKLYPTAVVKTAGIPWGWPKFTSYIYEIGIPRRYYCQVRTIRITRRQRIQPVDNSHRSDNPLSQRQKVKYTEMAWETVIEYDKDSGSEDLTDGKCFVEISSGR